MHAVILAGGRGKRLRPVTDYIPKPLVPVLGAPILEWQLRYLEAAGVRRVVVCAGHMAEQVEDYAGGRGGRGRARVAVSSEPRPLGTGGALRSVAHMVEGGSFLALNGDVITDIDLGRLRRVRDSVAAVPLRTSVGVLELGRAEGGAGGPCLVEGFREKIALPDVFMNAGLYHLSAAALDDMPGRGDVERTLFPRYAESGRLRCVRFAGAFWHSIDSFKDAEECAEGLRGRGERGGAPPPAPGPRKGAAP